MLSQFSSYAKTVLSTGFSDRFVIYNHVSTTLLINFCREMNNFKEKV